MRARKGRNLDHLRLFDEGCVKTRVDELTKAFISELALEEMRDIADRARRAFKPIPSAPRYSQQALIEKFGEEAERKAKEILLQERQNLVDARMEYIAKTLRQIIKQGRFLVYTVDEEDKPRKVKIYVEKMSQRDRLGKESILSDVLYIESYPSGVERLNQIWSLKTKLGRFRDYEPFLNDETYKLYHDASELLSLETVRIEKEKAKKHD